MDRGRDFTEVLQSAQEGDEEAVGALYLSLYAPVLRYLRAHVGQDCEDVASEVWMSVARSIKRFSGDQSDFRCWVYTIARRRVSDWVRSSPWYTVTELSTPVEAHPDPDSDAGNVVVDELAAHEMIARLAECLPEEQARVLLLRVIAGLSTDEVAQVVEKRPGAVRMLLHRALRSLAPLADELFEISRDET